MTDLSVLASPKASGAPPQQQQQQHNTEALRRTFKALHFSSESKNFSEDNGGAPTRLRNETESHRKKRRKIRHRSKASATPDASAPWRREGREPEVAAAAAAAAAVPAAGAADAYDLDSPRLFGSLSSGSSFLNHSLSDASTVNHVWDRGISRYARERVVTSSWVVLWESLDLSFACQ